MPTGGDAGPGGEPRAASGWAYRLEKVVLPPLLAWWFRFDVRGAGHLPDGGPLLIASNHASFIDPWLLAYALPRSPVRYLINEDWYRRSRLATWIFDSHGVVPARKGDAATTITRVCRALAAGDWVVVFPEGRITHDGAMNRLRNGIGWMAALSGVPVVPCGLRGNYQMLPRQRRIPRRHPIEIHIGEPLVFPGSPAPSPEPARVGDFVGSLDDRIRDLAGQPRQRTRERRAPFDLRPMLRDRARRDGAV